MTSTGRAQVDRPKFVCGAVAGRIDLPESLLEQARLTAQAHYEEMKAQEFSGHDVEDLALPAWLPKIEDWFPAADVRALGFRLKPGAQPLMYATCDAAPHEDDIHQWSLILVLHNDGLRFKQRRVSHKTAAGEWFIFDDRIEHEVRSYEKTTTYLLLSVQLEKLD